MSKAAVRIACASSTGDCWANATGGDARDTGSNHSNIAQFARASELRSDRRQENPLRIPVPAGHGLKKANETHSLLE